MTPSWTRPARYTVLITLLVAFLWILYIARPIAAPIIIAALISYLLYPAVWRLERRFNLSRPQAAQTVYFLFLAGLILGAINLGPIIGNQARSLTDEMRAARPQIYQALLMPFQEIGLEEELHDFFAYLEDSSAQFFQPERIFRLLNSATTNFAWLMLTLFLVYYFLLDWPRLREWIIGQFSPPAQPDVRKLQQRIKDVWRAYLRGQLSVMFLLGLLTTIGAAAIGLPKAILLGCTAALLAIIPSVGPAITLVIAAAVAWTQGSTYLEISNVLFMLLTIAVFSGIQMIEGAWLTPQIMGRRLQIHPGLIITVVIGTLTLGGVLLALVVVPLVASLGIILDYLRNRIYNQDPWALAESEIQKSPKSDS